MVRGLRISRLVELARKPLRNDCLSHLSCANKGSAACHQNAFHNVARTRLLSAPAAHMIKSRSLFSTTAAILNNATEGSTVPLDLTADGITTKIHVKPSYIHKPKAVENLLKNLPALLTDAVMPATAIESFSTKAWDLDEAADTIHRYLTVRQSDVTQIVADIKAASKAENHDPHIHIDGSRMTISCTTHVPPGLSMKDVKLARLIDQLLDDHFVDFSRSDDASEADILTYRQRGREHNMEAIRKAKLACDCG